MTLKNTLFFLLAVFYSFTIFAQNSSNPYREFVEKELAKSLEDTAISQSRYVYKMQNIHVDCGSDIEIFPKTLRRDDKSEEQVYRNVIYKSGAIGVIWLEHVGIITMNTRKYRLLVSTINEDILYSKTCSIHADALIPRTENIAKQDFLIVKICPYESGDESDELLMNREKGIILNFADSTQQQKIEQDLARYCNTKNLIMIKLIEAYYCEVNGYLANAIGLYQEVMAAEPNNLHYKKLYKNFLKVTGMDLKR